jgi:hypothetical protein
MQYIIRIQSKSECIYLNIDLQKEPATFYIHGSNNAPHLGQPCTKYFFPHRYNISIYVSLSPSNLAGQAGSRAGPLVS